MELCLAAEVVMVGCVCVRGGRGPHFAAFFGKRDLIQMKRGLLILCVREGAGGGPAIVPSRDIAPSVPGGTFSKVVIRYVVFPYAFPISGVCCVCVCVCACVRVLTRVHEYPRTLTLPHA